MPKSMNISLLLSTGFCVLATAWSGCVNENRQTSTVQSKPAPSAPSTPADLEKSCDKGEAKDCLTLGALYEEGKGGVARDESRAANLYEHACTAGNAAGCGELGTLYALGRGVKQDATKAAALFEKACNGGAPTACGILGALYIQGDGVTKDEARGAALFEKGCIGGDAQACYSLAICAQKGLGVEQNSNRATTLYEQACLGGYEKGCETAAASYLSKREVRPEDAKQAVRLFERGCTGGNAKSCHAAGLMYTRGVGVEKDDGRAKKLFSEACKAGNADSCHVDNIVQITDAVSRIKYHNKWEGTCNQADCSLQSVYKSPPPFHLNNEREASLVVEITPKSPSESLEKVVAREVDQIRNSLEVADYLEEDGHTPKDNIAVYSMKLGGRDVAFIKYRVLGAEGQRAPMPFTSIHGIVAGTNQMGFVHLATYYGGHQEAVRTDQILIMKELLKHLE